MKMTRGRLFLVALLAALLAAGAAAYKQWPRLLEKFRKQTATAVPGDNQVFATPPFSTKEPDRYRATRVFTSSEIPVTQKYGIARDGENRREEFESGTVYLETPVGRFLLYPAGKLYAELNAESDEVAAEQRGDFSPDRLLHETSTEARYLLLGTENLEGRKTTKYRVTSVDSHGENGSGVIWVDDELGMPIKSELVSGNQALPAKVVMELRDIRRDVDPKLFELPPEFTKVAIKSLLAEVTRSHDQAKKGAAKSTSP